MELISREEAIKKFKEYGIADEYDCEGILNECVTIESRPKGKWERTSWFHTCSVCGDANSDKDDEGDKIATNFCPNCGADMREDTEYVTAVINGKEIKVKR